MGLSRRGGGAGGPATQVIETGGPTTLTFGPIADGELVIRSGNTLIGTTVGGGTDTFVKASGTDTTAGVLSVKLPTGGDLTWTTNNAGGNETRTAVITNDKIVNAQINSAAGIVYSKMEALAALTVLANATNGSAAATAVSAGTDKFVFRRVGTALGWGLLDNTNLDPAAAIAYSQLANMAEPGLLGKFALGAGAVTTLLASTGSDGQVPTIQADGSIAWETPAGGGGGFTPGGVNRIPYAVAGPVLGDSANFTWDPSTYTLYGQGGSSPYLRLDTSTGSKFGFSTINFLSVDGTDVTAKVNNGAYRMVGQANHVNLVWGSTTSAASLKGGILMVTGTAPTGDPTAGACAIWFDGSVLKLRVGATVTTFTTA